MSGAEPPLPADPDDWFAESDYGPVSGAGGRLTADPRLGTLDESRLTPRAVIAVAVVLVALVVGALAVAGVFSSGAKHPTTTPPTRPATTTQTPTTTPSVTHVTPAPAQTLKPGDSGAQVKILQRALAKLGYASGKVDGDYGPSTQTAVKRFQTAKKLDADGVLGPKTLAALKQALRQSA